MRIIIPSTLWPNQPFTISEITRQMANTRTTTPKILVQGLTFVSFIRMLSLPSLRTTGGAAYLVVTILKVTSRTQTIVSEKGKKKV